MTRRTVMAARVGPASLRNGPRSVYINVPENIGADQQELVDEVLKKFLRYDDRLVYPDNINRAAPVIAFAEQHGLLTDPLSGESTPADLTIEIVDPARDDDSPSLTRLLAEQEGADHIITELPVIIA